MLDFLNILPPQLAFAFGILFGMLLTVVVYEDGGRARHVRS